MRSDQIILKNHPFFEGVDDWYIEELSNYAEHANFAAGDFIIREGQPAEKFYLIIKGKVNIYTEKLDPTTDGTEESVAIQTLNPGEILGWSWLVPPHKWRFDAKAAEDSEAIVLNGKFLRAKCEEDPKLGFSLMKRLMHSLTSRLTATRLQLSLYQGQPFTEQEGG